MLFRIFRVALFGALLVFAGLSERALAVTLEIGDVVIGAQGTTIKVFSATGSLKATVNTGGLNGSIDIARLSDGSFVAVDDDGRARLFDENFNITRSFSVASGAVYGVGVDDQDNLYFTGSCCNIRKYSSSGDFITSFGDTRNNRDIAFADGRLFVTGFSGFVIHSYQLDGTPTGSFSTGLLGPFGIIAGSDGLLRAGAQDNHIIRTFTLAGVLVSEFDADANSSGGLTGQLRNFGMDSANNIYVGSRNSQLTYKFDSAGNQLMAFNSGPASGIVVIDALANQGPPDVPAPLTFGLMVLGAGLVLRGLRRGD